MFHRHGKKGKSTQKTKPLKDLTRTTAANLLLAEEKRDALIQQIKEMIALDEVRFDSLCLNLLHHFANHCQDLPEASTSYYSQQGGLLDYALNRTEAALSLFQQYLTLDEEQGELSEEQKLWQYALFSASFLQGIGKLQIDYCVELYDNNGQFLKQWNPLLESLIAVGGFYHYELEAGSDEAFRRRLNLLIARLLMPSNAFAWLASHPQVLAIWLALLNEDMEGAGTLGAILIRADAVAIQRYFNQLTFKAYGSRAGRYGRVSTFTGPTSESIADREQQVGIEFIQWLTKSLDEGRLMINKPPLLRVPEGVLMTPEIFQLFMLENPEYKNWQAVQKAFLSLNLHALGVDGGVTSRFEQKNSKMHTGIVFAKYEVSLPEEVTLCDPSGQPKTIPATEVPHMSQSSSHSFTPQQPIYSTEALPHLNASGKWLEAESAPSKLPSFKPGVTNGG